MTDVPPIRRELVVDADPPVAFAVFTDRLGAWWPVDTHGVYGEGATVGFDAGDIVERSPDGERAVWGTVTEWDPPNALAFSWHPGKTPDHASRVRVTFSDAPVEVGSASRTRVLLEHTGWEVFADPAGARADYDKGWPHVLSLYGSDVAAVRATS